MGVGVLLLVGQGEAGPVELGDALLGHGGLVLEGLEGLGGVGQGLGYALS